MPPKMAHGSLTCEMYKIVHTLRKGKALEKHSSLGFIEAVQQ